MYYIHTYKFNFNYLLYVQLCMYLYKFINYFLKNDSIDVYE